MTEAAHDAGQEGGREQESELCDVCHEYDLDKLELEGYPILLCVEGGTLTQNVNSWGDFLHTLLKTTCAARNTNIEAWPCWELLIHIKNPDADVGYCKLFSEKLTDRLKPMAPGSSFSEHFQIKMFLHEEKKLHFLVFKIFPESVGIVAKNLHSPQSFDHCLLDAGFDCIVHFLFCRDDALNEMFPRLEELRDKSDEEEVSAHESASVQLKTLQPNLNKENVKKKKKQHQEIFDPQIGADYVEWVWNKQTKTLGEYVSAFAKLRTGGVLYCGVKEEKGKNKVKALALRHGWKVEIEEALEEKITKQMLWVERKPNSKEGYTVLKPGDIKKGQHFDVDFIPVRGPSTAGTSLYILEVRVASFDGVVFNHKGPEVYDFQNIPSGDSFTPVRVDPLTWLKRLRQYAWCSKYETPRKPRCGKKDWCTQCRAAVSED